MIEGPELETAKTIRMQLTSWRGHAPEDWFDMLQAKGLRGLLQAGNIVVFEPTGGPLPEPRERRLHLYLAGGAFNATDLLRAQKELSLGHPVSLQTIVPIREDREPANA